MEMLPFRCKALLCFTKGQEWADLPIEVKPISQQFMDPFLIQGAAVQMEKNAQPGFKSTKSNQEGKRNSLMITKL